MKKNTEPLRPDTFYHIYNRGINGELIFKEERNYPYFLRQFGTYTSPVLDTYAYCLLNNHFHLLVKTKSELEILKNFKKADENLNSILDHPLFTFKTNLLNFSIAIPSL